MAQLPHATVHEEMTGGFDGNPIARLKHAPVHPIDGQLPVFNPELMCVVPRELVKFVGYNRSFTCRLEAQG